MEIQNVDKYFKVAIAEETEKSRYKYNNKFYELLRLSSEKKESKEDVLKDWVRYNYMTIALAKNDKVIAILNEKLDKS